MNCEGSDRNSELNNDNLSRQNLLLPRAGNMSSHITASLQPAKERLVNLLKEINELELKSPEPNMSGNNTNNAQG
uniref:Bm13534 n=1 Tax=Brugia malayi TaxID=6279 RepID=A0A0J9Y0Q6_BRUMA|nr:Bm13534 [Brugia malayi]